MFALITGYHSRVMLRIVAVASVLALGLILLASRADAGSGSLTGKVLSAGGNPLDEVEITLWVRGESVPTTTGFTNELGEFNLEVPAPNNILVRMAGEGHEPFETELAFGKGESRSLNVQLITTDAAVRNQAIEAYNEGVEALDAQDTETAKQRFRKAVAIDPDFSEPWLVLARLYMADHLYAEAAEAAEAYLQHDPMATEGLVIAYDAYTQLGDLEELARLGEALRSVPELAPKLAVHVYNEGAEAYGAGNDDVATVAFRTAIELDPRLAAAHSGVANSLYRLERFEDGLVQVDAWLELIPDDPAGLQMKFVMLNALGRRDDADDVLMKFAEQDPIAAAELLLRRAELDFRADNYELARPGLERAVELNPKLARAHYRLGLIYMSTDVDRAKEHLRRFLELTPDDPDASAARQLIAAA